MKEDAPEGILALDHVNITTGDVDGLANFYCQVIGLTRGPRPPFSFGGAWLYCGPDPVVHLVDGGPVAGRPGAAGAPGLSHFAFRARGLERFLDRLRQAGVSHQLAPLVGSTVTQVKLRDPDGNALHVDFGSI
jgi:catechol 2,3-dioxygenase-like lactoylglutathione lyase family enzyme